MLFDQKMFFVKEQVQFLKLAGTYDILDPETSRPLAVAKEEPGAIIKLLRLFISKLLLPTKVVVYNTTDQSVLLSIVKPLSFIRSKVSIFNNTGNEIGYFKSKVLTIGGGFWVYDPSDHQVAEVKGDWKGWNFKFLSADGEELGTVTKKWAGIGKELFTTADNYIIALTENKELPSDQVILLVAAGLAIDLVFKEKQ